MFPDDAYRLLPLPFGEWAYWLPFHLMVFLFLGLALLVLATITVLLHRRDKYRLLRYVTALCIPLWGGFLFFAHAPEWVYWTVGWFYCIAAATAVSGILRRAALPYMFAFLLAALLQHQASVIMVFVLART